MPTGDEQVLREGKPLHKFSSAREEWIARAFFVPLTVVFVILLLLALMHFATALQ